MSFGIKLVDHHPVIPCHVAKASDNSIAKRTNRRCIGKKIDRLAKVLKKLFAVNAYGFCLVRCYVDWLNLDQQKLPSNAVYGALKVCHFSGYRHLADQRGRVGEISDP